MANGKYELIDMSNPSRLDTKTRSISDSYQPVNPSVPEKRTIKDILFNLGWRGGLIRWTALSTTVWLITIIVYASLFATTNVTYGSGVVMTDSCTAVSIANVLVHLALNIATTMMLCASTYAMESLCCPTRLEIDAAHKKGGWLGIGGLSLRNFRFISKRRSILWLSLWITSIPLHLFFNAVFYTSSQAHQYAVAVVTEQYFTSDFTPTLENTSPSNFANLGGYINQSLYETPDDGIIVTLLNDARAAELTTLTPSECLSTYANGFVRNAGDVVVVVNNSNDSPLVWTRYPLRMLSPNRKHTNQDGFNWICHDTIVSGVPQNSNDICSSEDAKYLGENGNWTVYGSPVQSCLSRTYPTVCHLIFNVWLMLAVLVIGVLKTAIMFYILFRLAQEHNLRTFGDAVSSFLQQEDPTTKGMCLTSSATFVKGLQKAQPCLYTGAQQRWWHSGGPKQFWVTLASTIIYIICFAIALNFAIQGANGTAFGAAIGQTNIQSLAKVEADDAHSDGLIPNLLVANIPQVGIAILFMAYNDVFSKMLMAHEFDKYTRQRRPLRVSERTQGMQRGTRYLNLPVRWAIPLMTISALLHWLASASLFAVRVDGVNNDNVVDDTDQLSRLGYNARAIVALIVVLAFAVFVLLYAGWQKFGVNFGEMGNSLVISAACHPDQPDLHLQKVSWGEMTASDGVRHCSFSGREPVRPEVGEYYS